MPSASPEHDRSLLVAMPLRHLESAQAVQDAHGFVVMPAGSPGALEETPIDTPVLFLAIDAGEAEVPAATWVARFAGPVGHDPDAGWPGALPQTWLDEHPATVSGATRGEPQSDRDDECDDEEEGEDEGALGPQSFFRVRALTPLPQTEWIFANELVPKQQRRGRTFLPRAPRLIARPD